MSNYKSSVYATIAYSFKNNLRLPINLMYVKIKHKSIKLVTKV